jgi:hypothetical protein
MTPMAGQSSCIKPGKGRDDGKRVIALLGKS